MSFVTVYHVDSNFNCTPNLYRLIYQSNEPSSMIVLEDVCMDGFTMITQPPEDFEVSRKIVQRLAKFHAGSFFLVSEHVNFF